jgi:rfaE bifunctional protein kinase chain/domain
VKDKFNNALIHGNFEVLHTGHIRLFVYAKEISSELIVALCIAGLDELEIERRLTSLRTITLIDKILTFTDLAEMIVENRPDAIIKGREFADLENIEEVIASEYGGRVIFSSGGEDTLQTTALPKLLSHTSIITDSTISFLERNDITLSKLHETISSFRDFKILVVGDVILDEFIECVPTGLSQESSSLVARPLWSKYYIGGAGIIASHCSSLGAKAALLTILGDDKEADEIRKFCTKFGVFLHEISDSKHPTVLKQRFRNQQQTLFRLNRFRQDGIAKQIRKEFEVEFKRIINDFDAVIFADFSYGVFDTEDVNILVKIARAKGVFVSADSQTSSQIGNLSRFAGANLICPTEREARIEIRDQDGLIVLSNKLLSLMGSDFIFLKLGPDGVLINGKNLKTDHIPALNESPVDVSGAGDSLLAASTLAFAAKVEPSTAAFIGSLAAAIQVSRPGNVPILNQEMIDLIDTLD